MVVDGAQQLSPGVLLTRGERQTADKYWNPEPALHDRQVVQTKGKGIAVNPGQGALQRAVIPLYLERRR